MAYGRTGMHSCQPSLLQSGIYTKFLSMLVNTTKKIQVGHDVAPGTTMGYLTSTQGLDKMERHIADATSKGGIVPCGGKTLTNLPGNLFAPTIISGMIPSMLTSQEEIFDPPLGLYRFETERRKPSRWQMILAWALPHTSSPKI